MTAPYQPIRLHGFNNLTKRLNISLYDICYACGSSQRKDYFAHIDETYNATRLTHVLTQVTEMIGANILNIAQQDYDPQGASVAMLISEDTMLAPPWRSHDVLMHLDKSHLTVHTYPESHPHNGISTFRVDIDVSTCGRISPLNALNYLIASFRANIVSIDYQVRGFTRDIKGNKHYIDHDINSIQNFLTQDIKQHYFMRDVNVSQARIFHTKMRLKESGINNDWLGQIDQNYSNEMFSKVKKLLQQEIMDIFKE